MLKVEMDITSSWHTTGIIGLLLGLYLMGKGQKVKSLFGRLSTSRLPS